MTYPINIFCQISQTQVVDNITSSNQQWNAIRLKQFEVVFVCLIAQKALNMIWNKKKNENNYFSPKFLFFLYMESL